VVETARGVARGAFSAEERVRASLAEIARRDGELNAFVEVFEGDALARAREIDAARARGETLGALAGVPVGVKDNIVVSRGRTTCGSRMLEGYRSPFTATAVERLEAAGAVVVGKTNMDEFGMGSSGEHSAFGVTRNPHDAGRVPGGSSSGSAAAVGAGMVAGALGSDTGGSIRQPSSHCGVVGIKPTYGRVSRYGLVAYASSLDQIGPIAGSVEDAATVLGVIAGRDAADMTSSGRAVEGYAAEAVGGREGRGVEGLTVAVPRGMWEGRGEASVHPGVIEAVERAGRVLAAAGARVVECGEEEGLGDASRAIAAYYLIACAEASSNLARFDGVRYGRRAEGDGLVGMYERTRSEGFGREVKRRILLGTHILSAGYAEEYYATALRARGVIAGEYGRVLSWADAVLMPVAPAPAFCFGEKSGDALALYLEDAFTVGVNLAGVPAMSVPGGCAEVAGGVKMPVGVQVVGRKWGESAMVRVAGVVERGG
jgi:aspartyl-tRNA(Asn)/glutamyl-tRNA(Gln) amidotransferase subunit A